MAEKERRLLVSGAKMTELSRQLRNASRNPSAATQAHGDNSVEAGSGKTVDSPDGLGQANTEPVAPPDMATTTGQRGDLVRAQGSSRRQAQQQRAAELNPSLAGHKIISECEEYLAWINGYLQRENERAIYDLRRAFADGVTLVKLLEIIAGQRIPGVQARPILRLQKAENINRCLQFINSHGVPVNGIKADDLVNGNLKSVLTLCESLRQRHKNLSSSGPLVDEGQEQGKSVSPTMADSLPGVLPEEPSQRQTVRARLRRDEPSAVPTPRRSSLPSPSSKADQSVTSTTSPTASPLSGHRTSSLSALGSQRLPGRTEAWTNARTLEGLRSSSVGQTNGKSEKTEVVTTDGPRSAHRLSQASSEVAATLAQPSSSHLSKMSSMTSQMSVDAQGSFSPVEDRLKELLDADNPMLSPIAFSPLTTFEKPEPGNDSFSDMPSSEAGSSQLTQINSQLAQLAQGIRSSLQPSTQSGPARRGASVAPAVSTPAATSSATLSVSQVTSIAVSEEPGERKHAQAAHAIGNSQSSAKTKSQHAAGDGSKETGRSPPKPHKKSLFDSLLHPTQRRQLGVVHENSSTTNNEEKPPPLPQTEPPNHAENQNSMKPKNLHLSMQSAPRDDKQGPELVPFVKNRESSQRQQHVTSPPPLSAKLRNGGSLEESPTSAFQRSSPLAKAASGTLPIRPQPVLAQTNLDTDQEHNSISSTMLLQRLSALEEEQQTMQIAFQAERDVFKAELAAQGAHIQRLDAQSLQQQRRYLCERRAFLSQIRELEGQLVGVARSTAYLATQVQNIRVNVPANPPDEHKPLTTSLHEIREMLHRLERSAGEDSDEGTLDKSFSSTPEPTGTPTAQRVVEGQRTPTTVHRQDRQAALSPLQYWSPGCDAHYDIVKVKKFFGQEPPHLLRQFLKRMGYEYLAKKFEKHRVGLLELPHLTEDQLKSMKIPAGPRMRILHELELIQQSTT